MKKSPKLNIICVVAMPCLLAACGGGGSSSASPDSANYHFVIPQLNSQRVYAETIVDNSKNTINLSFTETVIAVSSDGTYQVLKQDPSNNSVTINGTSYSIQPTVTTYNSSGQPLSSVNNSTKVSCTYTPFGPGITYPIELGDTFSSVYNETCGSATIAYTQSGAAVTAQSVTVPAGLFQTLVLKSSISFTDASGIAHGQTIATYRDASTGSLIEYQESDTESPKPSNGFATSITIELESTTL